MKHLSQRAMIAGAMELKGDEEDPMAVVTKSLADLTKTVDDRLKKVEEKGLDKAVVDRLDALEKKANRPGTGTDKDEDEDAVAERKSFGIYLRLGNQIQAEDQKALTVSNDTQGGYLAPAEMSTEFIKDLVEVSPIRSIASVRSITSPSVKYPKRTGITNAQWEGELEESQESTVTFGQAEVTARKMMTYVDISNELLADSGGTAEAEVRSALADDFGQKEGRSFILGDGVKQPEGLLVNPDIEAFLNGHATNLSADALVGMMYDLPAAYRNNGSWLMSGTALAKARLLKDGQNNFLWQPSFQLGQPETLLGRPITEAVDMPDIANGTFPIMFGDFTRAYRIVDRLAMSILVDPYTQATKGVTRIHATRRVGGRVIQAAALRKLKMATS